jgi:hypothetical protein
VVADTAYDDGYGPVPDTPENRARYGDPASRAGRATAPRGND